MQTFGFEAVTFHFPNLFLKVGIMLMIEDEQEVGSFPKCGSSSM
jgi:hypothetical protein